jgi:ankyrin repeat protein
LLVRSLDELFDASRAGDREAAARVLARSPQLARVTGPHPIWGGEPTALHVAVENGRADVAALLLEAGADPNHPSDMYDGWTPMVIAAGRESRELVDLLRAHGAHVDAWEAAALGDVTSLSEIVEQRPAVVRERRANQAPPLHFAATVDVARLLVRHGAELDALDKYGATAARAAAYGRRTRRPVARFLMDVSGETDAWLLAAVDDVDGLQALAERGVDILTARRGGLNPASGFGETPLHTAAALANLTTVSFLIGQGVDVDISSGPQGDRPLHYAAKRNARDVVDALLAAGANPRLKDADHEATPADWARFAGHFALATYLEDLEVI